MMKSYKIGIIDYHTGNLSSVSQSIQLLGHRCHISDDVSLLSEMDLLLLPGVGAFPAAMQSLDEKKLTEFIQNKAKQGKPILGICLGMQLMASCSIEFGRNVGLGLIPGDVLLLSSGCHIGWNDFQNVGDDPIMMAFNDRTFYFNHSYFFNADSEYCLGLTTVDFSFPIAVRRDNVVGLQFHPEKSQSDGSFALKKIIEELCFYA
jgi:glutamine amidotransferase